MWVCVYLTFGQYMSVCKLRSPCLCLGQLNHILEVSFAYPPASWPAHLPPISPFERIEDVLQQYEAMVTAATSEARSLYYTQSELGSGWGPSMLPFPNQRPLFQARLLLHDSSHTLATFIDSGADTNIIDEELAHQL